MSCLFSAYYQRDAVCQKKIIIKKKKSVYFLFKSSDLFVFFFFYENRTNRGVSNDRRPNAATERETSVGRVFSVKPLLERNPNNAKDCKFRFFFFHTISMNTSQHSDGRGAY